MPIRVATYADIAPLAPIVAAAFKDEDLFGRFMHPRREEHPDGMRLFYLRKLRGIYAAGADNFLLVSYNVDPATGRETHVTGMAHWERFRATGPRANSYAQAALQRAVYAYNAGESVLFPDQALDVSRMNILSKMMTFTKHHWTGSRAESWYLSMLAVDPRVKGQGNGRELVKWGFDRAREEGIGCSVVSSEGNERFYQRCGFELIGYVQDEGGDANPFKAVLGGAILFWDNGISPTGVKKYGEA